jgi:hypothetical protein
MKHFDAARRQRRYILLFPALIVFGIMELLSIDQSLWGSPAAVECSLTCVMLAGALMAALNSGAKKRRSPVPAAHYASPRG